MVPVEQPQLGRGVTIHTALEDAPTASPNSCSIKVQPGGEHGLAWGICKGKDHGHSSTASARASQVHSKLVRFPQHTGQRGVPRAAANSCVDCALRKDSQTSVGGIQPLCFVLSYALVLD